MAHETSSVAPLPILQAGAAPTTLAPGFRFHPTDEELVCYYLKRKVSDKPMRFDAIGEVDILKNEPWDLVGYSRMKSRDQEWFFFSALDKKFGNDGTRMNRATSKGYWKATGKDREVRNDSQLVGMKKTLVFYNGRSPNGQRTNWIMHEYRLVEAGIENYGTGQAAYLLCRIFHKNNVGRPNGNIYAPFIEEEWDDGEAAVVPGVDTVDEVAPVDDAYIEGTNVEQVQDTPSIYMEPLSVNNGPPNETQNLLPVNNGTPRETKNLFPVNGEPPREIQSLLHVCKREREEDVTPQLVLEPNESPHVPQPTFNTANLDSSVPPGISKFINDLQEEVHKVSVDSAALKLKIMSAHAMIDVLQSRLDLLSNENENLKRSIRDRDT